MLADGRSAEHDVLWNPPMDGSSRIESFRDFVNAKHDLSLLNYDDLWSWSVDELPAFWSSVGEFFDPPVDGSWTPAVTPTPSMPEPDWFPRAKVNYAELALAMPGRRDNDVVVVARSQTRQDVTLTAAELRSDVARARAGFVAAGVVSGDCVAAYAPNIPETLVFMLAAASMGVTFVSCSPEFGVQSVVDRLVQVSPRAILAVDGYRYGNKLVERTREVREIVDSLPSLELVVHVGYLDPTSADVVTDGTSWADFLDHDNATLEYARVPFAHPLYVLFSSGTTGLPKAIVHGHGGISIEHLKFLGLHLDLGPKDRFFWYTTTGWTMWNILVSGLLVGSTIVMFDGDPLYGGSRSLWELANSESVSYFGVSAPFLLQCEKEDLDITAVGKFDKLRIVGTTGAPLSEQGFRWVVDATPANTQLQSIAGGTDICSAFVGANPMVPVFAGRISARCLGSDAQSVDAAGQDLTGEVGELVVRKPMPSMPVRFKNDPDDKRYHAAYFDMFPGSWRHGDWIRFWPDGSCVISGRSDATLNRGGVRLGTAEFYIIVDQIRDIEDSVIVHLEDPNGGLGQLILLVAAPTSARSQGELASELRSRLVKELSPRHVPDAIWFAHKLPRTISGKRLEVPIKRILQGQAPGDVLSAGAVNDPLALSDLIETIAHYRKTAVHDTLEVQ